jgi:CxxC-x17-CxxC domain-containing protein
LAFQDKTLTCADCGASFTFSAAEQEFFQSKGYTNEPKRCPNCRQTRKAECGKETEVPFEPREGRPVYCSDCFSKMRTNR